jgi:hypothetical protein
MLECETGLDQAEYQMSYAIDEGHEATVVGNSGDDFVLWER